MKISDNRANKITVPLEAPFRNANGYHSGGFVRNIAELETDNGPIGLGEMGGGCESAELVFPAMKPYLNGNDPACGEEPQAPEGPGPGVKLNREKLGEYSELSRRLAGYPYDQDTARPRWTPIVRNDRWADPNDDRPVHIPF